MRKHDERLANQDRFKPKDDVIYDKTPKARKLTGKERFRPRDFDCRDDGTCICPAGKTLVSNGSRYRGCSKLRYGPKHQTRRRGYSRFGYHSELRLFSYSALRRDMNPSVDPSITHIYETWHNTVKEHDLTGTVALYAEDAILETPLALAVYPTQKTGIVVGRSKILTFFEDSLRKFPSDLAQWYRTGIFFTNEHQLVWEYPRNAPQGEQVDLVEIMEIRNGLIAHHRVYWGWYGARLVAPALRP
ncbi:nuclear transport factor 2 family protein [Pseudomonas aeruginosa]|uniref:nuclear transport factor 2 family protein n=1 Tax=Pseudomonas aeruginosa TaxID=287 RepID=UPI003CC55DC3